MLRQVDINNEKDIHEFIIIHIVSFKIPPPALSEAVFDYIGTPFVTAAGLECNLLIKSTGANKTDIVIRPLEDGLISADGKHKIPIENIVFNNNEEDIYLKYNVSSNLLMSLEGGISKSVIAKIRDYGMVPAGSYSLNFEVLQINSDTKNVIQASDFTLQFLVPVYQKLSFYDKNPSIKVDVNNALQKNKSFKTERNHEIYITSNTDWVLLLKTGDLTGRQPGDYYVRVVSAPASATDKLNERVRLESNKEIILAKGKAPANNEYASIEYSIEGHDNKFLHPGEYTTGVKFILREDR